MEQLIISLVASVLGSMPTVFAMIRDSNTLSPEDKKAAYDLLRAKLHVTATAVAAETFRGS